MRNMKRKGRDYETEKRRKHGGNSEHKIKKYKRERNTNCLKRWTNGGEKIKKGKRKKELEELQQLSKKISS